MIRLRAAVPSDIPSFLAIYAPYITDTTYSFEYTVPSLPDFAVTADGQNEIEEVVQTDPFYYAPVREGDLVGQICYRRNGQTIAEAPLYADRTAEPAEKASDHRFWSRLSRKQFDSSLRVLSLWIK